MIGVAVTVSVSIVSAFGRKVTFDLPFSVDDVRRLRAFVRRRGSGQQQPMLAELEKFFREAIDNACLAAEDHEDQGGDG